MDRLNATVVVSQQEVWSASAAFAAACELQDRGHSVRILDASPLQPVVPDWWRLRLLDSAIRMHPSSPTRVLRRMAIARGMAFERVERHQTEIERLSHQASELYAAMPKQVDELEVWTPFGGRLGRSLTSLLTTTVLRTEQPRADAAEAICVAQVRAFLTIRECVLGDIRDSAAGIVAVFNGRLPVTAAAAAAVDEADVELLFYEYAPPTNWVYLQPFPSQDRVLTQQLALHALRSTPDRDVEDARTTFLVDRVASRATNPFLVHGGALQPEDREQTQRAAMLFTSSPDEFVGVGPGWEHAGWRDQLHAFETVSARLRALGFKVLIRVHPNMQNKSWGAFARTVTDYAPLADRLVLPTDPINSYTLLEQADLVVVWGSTIGLEAVSRRLPTYCLGPVTYDQLTDVRALPDEDAVLACEFLPYEVQPRHVDAAILAYQRANGTLDGAGTMGTMLQELQGYSVFEGYVAKSLRVVFAPITVWPLLRSGPRPLIRLAQLGLGPQRAARLIRGLFRIAGVRIP